MTISYRRIWNTLVWTVVSTVLGCLIAALMANGLTRVSVWAQTVDVARQYGVFVFAVAALGAVSGAIIGDLMGLRRHQSPRYIAWAEEQRDRRQFDMGRESLILALGWVLLCLGLKALLVVPAGIWILFSVIGLARVMQLGHYLHLQRLYHRLG